MNIILFQFVNYTLSFIMWMVLGRVLLKLVTGNKDTIVLRLFSKITDPVFGFVRKALPFVQESCIPAVTILIIIAIRLVLILTLGPAVQRP